MLPSLFPTALDSTTNPTPTTPLSGGGNETVRHTVQHILLNSAVTNLEEKVGINWSQVNTTLDWKTRLLQAIDMVPSSGFFEETLPSGVPFPTSFTWYTDATKTIKVLQADLTYGPGSKKFLMTTVHTLYDETLSNNPVVTVTDAYTRTGPFKSTKTRTVVWI